MGADNRCFPNGTGEIPCSPGRGKLNQDSSTVNINLFAENNAQK